MKRVTKDGVITVEEAKGTDTYVEEVIGMQFDRGYLSPYFITDADSMTAEYENPYLLITDKKISNMQEIIPILEKSLQSGRALLIIAEDVEESSTWGAGRQPAAGQFEDLRCQSPRVRRPSQGHARGHRHPDRRDRHLRGKRLQARRRRPLAPRHRRR